MEKGKVIPLYQEGFRLDQEIMVLDYQESSLRDREYLATWITGTAELNENESELVRKKLNIPKGKLEDIQKRKSVLEMYQNLQNKTEEIK